MVAEIQRSRLLAGAVRAVEELGYGGVTVAQVTRRARVSRRTFYELFADRDECLAAVLEHVLALIEVELAVADLEGAVWRERVRMGLWAILSFFDREPVLARVCVVHSVQGGPVILKRRGEVLARLAGIVDEGRGESARGQALGALTAEGLVGAACAILHARLLTGQRMQLRGLLGELMGMIVLPYLGAAAARKEQTRPAPERVPGAARKFVKAPRAVADPLDGVPMRLTYRTARVLEGVGEHPGACNREIAERAGISDQGQVSKLLSRLERLGLLAKGAPGYIKGEPNAWQLTSRGEFVARSIRVPTASHQRVA
ncbi:MAG TPA: TetR family transcriptional regulator [Solirubrobacteraceae bacterium]|jgi:AcrR family transcriptional regulator